MGEMADYYLDLMFNEYDDPFYDDEPENYYDVQYDNRYEKLVSSNGKVFFRLKATSVFASFTNEVK